MQRVARRTVLRSGALGLGVLGASFYAGPLEAIVRAPAARAGELPEVTSRTFQGFVTETVEGSVHRSRPASAQGPFSMVGFDGPPEARIRIRHAEGDGEWSDWREVPQRQADEQPDPDSEEADPGVDGSTEPVWVRSADRLQVEVENARPEDLDAHLIDSMGLAEAASAAAADSRMAAALGLTGAATAHASTAPPSVISRAQWGADESWRSGSPRAASSLRFGVVHHTVTGNGYSQGEAAGVVRGIYRYHAISRGWNDIGYNFLVDRFGRIYEGRAGGIERPIVGAHAGGFNTGSVGIAVIGTFTSGDVPEVAQEAVASILAWKFRMHGIDPRATVTLTSGGSTRYSSGTQVTKPTIIGHRDVSATSCPGDGSYRHIESLRRRVAATELDLVEPLARIGGVDGIETAILLSQLAFEGDRSAERAVIATEAVFADAAAGGPLAGRGGPIMLTWSDRLDERVRDELERVLPAGKEVYLLGSEAALGTGVERALSDRWNVKRLAGKNREETAALAAKEVVAREGRDVALIARAGPDDAWADGLAGSAYGARHGCPVLLTDSDELSPEVREALEELGISRTIVLGGPSAVSDAVMNDLPSPTRVAGQDRAGTARAVAEELWGLQHAGDRGGGVLVAGGYAPNAWKDALTSASVAAARDLPVVLSRPDRLPAATETYLGAIGGGAGESFVIGGTGALQDEVASRSAALLGS
ncbi:hypothetical protein ER308_06570 [Egibacter rhizosphaerae]|uniref:Peptidoglycan recognition protein family domain-containing protein n=1 Tax=Egibacter rhizosphaerae TaxID=1670831 RepID=A0A411YDK7_9ACTN|nr:cell wall-binding repeat-containing protein [Egibacter rhizosphaerae]QBI19237.1 hypothetical protein ER308_06570 [Egibacter rhizosphaerae]